MLTFWIVILGEIGLYMWFDERVFIVVTLALMAQAGYWLLRGYNGLDRVTAPMLALIGAAVISYQGALEHIEEFGYLPRYRLAIVIIGAVVFMAVTRYYSAAQIRRQIARAGLVIFGQGALGYLLFRALGMDSHVWNAIVGRPTYTAALFVVLLPFGIYLSGRARGIYYVFAAICVGEMLFTSRSMVMALAAMGAALIWTSAPLEPETKRLAAIISLIALVALLTVLIWIRPGTVGVRLELWRAALSDFAHNPVRGVGIGRYYVFGPTGESQSAAVFAHNMYLTIAAETGLFGIAALVWLVRELWRTRQRRARAANLALLGYAVFSLYNDPWLWWNTNMLIYVIMAIGG